MKVNRIILRKPSANPPKRRNSLKRGWLKKRNNKNLHWPEPRGSRCSNFKKRKRKTYLLTSSIEKN